MRRIHFPNGIPIVFGEEPIEAVKATVSPKTDPATQKIRRKRREYETKAAQSRELLIQTPGTTLGKTQQRITIRKQGKVLGEAPLKHLEQVTIQSSGISLSSNLVHACASARIRLDFLDQRGRCYASLGTPRYPSPRLAVAQVEAYTNQKGGELARQWVLGKLRNQINLVRYFEKNRGDSEAPTPERVASHLEIMDKEWQRASKIKPGKHSLDILQGKLMAMEGRAAEQYWAYFKSLLQDRIAFPGRERRGARDPVNSALNYGYGILYGRVQEALRQARLMPVFSYLHSPSERDQPTLSFDLIEPFRSQAVDRVIWVMIRKGQLPVVKKDGLLTEDSRNLIAQKVVERLNRKEYFRGQRLSLDEILLAQARELAEYLMGELDRYRPYIRKW